MQPVKSCSPEVRLLPCTSLKYKVLKLPNLAPISVIVEGPLNQINDLLSKEPSGSYLLSQRRDGLTLCVQNNSPQNLFTLPDDPAGNDCGVQWKELKFTEQNLAENIEGLSKECRLKNPLDLDAQRLSVIKIYHLTEDCPVELVSLAASIKQSIVRIEKTAFHTFIILSNDGSWKDTTFAERVYPITICIKSNFNPTELDELFAKSSRVGDCYIRFSSQKGNNLTLVSRVNTDAKISKIAFKFDVERSSINTWTTFYIPTNPRGETLLRFLSNHQAQGVNSFNYKLFESTK